MSYFTRISALGEIDRFEQEKSAKQPLVNDRTMQIALAQQKYKEAKESYDQSVEQERQSLERIERQQAMAKIGGEGEQVILAAMLKEHESTVKGVEFAKSNLDEASILRDQIPAIVESLEQINAQVEQLDHEQSQMQAIADDLWQAIGIEKAASIAEEIIQTRDAYEEHVRRTPELETEHLVAVQKINSLKEDYPDLYQRLLASHGHALRQDTKATEAEQIVKDFRAFVVSLLTHGPYAKKRIYEDKKELAEYLAIDAPTAKTLMSGATWQKKAHDDWGREIAGGTPWHPALDSVDELLREVRRSGR